MRHTIFHWAAVTFCAAGCAAPGVREAPIEPHVSAPTPAERPSVVPASYDEIVIPATLTGDAPPPAIAMAGEAEPLATGLTLPSLEDLALSNSPAVAQAEARVRALRGKWLQAGLPPNPIAGYSAGEIGADGSAGQQGALVGQTYITAHKLQRDRDIVCAEIERAQEQLAAVHQRVTTDTRAAFYRALVAQRRVETAQQLSKSAAAAVSASRDLLAAEEIPLAALLQTEVAEQTASAGLAQARNAQAAAWRTLAAVTAADELPMQPLDGDATLLPDHLAFEAQLAKLQTESPEVAAAMAGVGVARRTLSRACVEPVPNVTTLMTLQYDASSDDTIAGVQVTLPLPLWNRNQGGVRQAQAEVAQAMRNVDRVERDLARRLADVSFQYENSRTMVEAYSQNILPRAQQTLDLVNQGYAMGEIGYLEQLTAQRTMFSANLSYLDALDQLWASWCEIDGLLLKDSLQSPVLQSP